MARFRIGGAGPDGKGLGWIAGITGRKFDKSGEVYETDDPNEIDALRQCAYAEETDDEASNPGQAGNTFYNVQFKRSREDLRCRKMKELIRIGSGLYRVGMTKAELIDRIIARGYEPKQSRPIISIA